MARPAFGRLSRLWCRDGAALIRTYGPLADRVAHAYGRRYPGIDWPPIVHDALYLAAFTYDPGKCPRFVNWLRRNVNDLATTHVRTFWRRRAKLKPHPIEEVDLWCSRLL